MEKIFTVICERGISAGYVILAVIVLRLLFRKSPRWVMGILWALVAIRLICPIVVESPFSVVPKGPLFDKETSNLKSEQEVQQINNLPDQNQTAGKQVAEIKEHTAKQDETKDFWTDKEKQTAKNVKYHLAAWHACADRIWNIWKSPCGISVAVCGTSGAADLGM